VDEISVSYYLAFIDGPERIRFMDECYRILKPEGKLLVKEAHWSGMDAVADPLVKWPPICEKSFMPFNKAWREASGRTHYPIKCDFDFGYGMSMPNEIAQRNDEFKQFAIKHYNNAAVDLLVTLTKRSG
jgi:ubiquinone/menaquinone biosynthesis C-methylase UbiE